MTQTEARKYKHEHIEIELSQSETIEFVRKLFKPHEAIFVYLAVARQFADQVAAVKAKGLPKGISEEEDKRSKDALMAVLSKLNIAMPPETRKMLEELCEENFKLHIQFDHSVQGETNGEIH